MTPVEKILEGVNWEKVSCESKVRKDGLPWVTHQGVLEIMGFTLRCYRLCDGRAIINADDMNNLFGGILKDESPIGKSEPT
ncbi:MAG: hypothetical protein NVS3B3_18650 [Aquirhabdus sp.]